MTTEMKTRKWQARFRNSIGGIVCAGVRRNGRGDWQRPEDVPGCVREFLQLECGKGARPVWRNRDWKRTSAMHAEINAACKTGSHYHRGFLIVDFTVDEKGCERPAAIEVDRAKLRDCLRDLNEGRNLDCCFDLCSFGFKDADLQPEGCCGIRKVIGIVGKRVVVEVAGHKTFCDPCHDEDSGVEMSDNNSVAREIAREIVCDCGSHCEWDGDSWCASFAEDVYIPIVHKRDVVDYEATARRIVRKCESACDPFQSNWAEADKSLNELYESITQTPGA